MGKKRLWVNCALNFYGSIDNPRLEMYKHFRIKVNKHYAEEEK